MCLSPVQVYLSYKSNYHFLHTCYVLGILNMLLLIHVTILRSRKWHSTNFTKEETQTQTLKGLPMMPEPLIATNGI